MTTKQTGTKGGWDKMQVKALVKQVRKSLGEAWDYMVPEVRGAMIDQHILGVVVTSLPFAPVSALDISKFRHDCYVEAGLAKEDEGA